MSAQLAKRSPAQVPYQLSARTHPAGFENTPDGPPETPFPPNCSPEFCVRPRRRRRAPLDGGMGPRNPFFFRQRAGAVNWRIVGACDLLKVVKEGDISEDDLKRVLDRVQSETNDACSRVDEVVKHKETEILEV